MHERMQRGDRPIFEEKFILLRKISKNLMFKIPRKYYEHCIESKINFCISNILENSRFHIRITSRSRYLDLFIALPMDIANDSSDLFSINHWLIENCKWSSNNT